MPSRGRNRPPPETKADFARKILSNKAYMSKTSKTKDHALIQLRIKQFETRKEKYLRGYNFDQNYWNDFTLLLTTFTAVELLFILKREFLSLRWTDGGPPWQDPYTPEKVAHRIRYKDIKWRSR